MNEITQFRKKFYAEHGDRKTAVPFESGYWLLFEDGWKLAADPENGHWEAAPTDNIEKLELLVEYFTIRQRFARQYFKVLKMQIEVTFCDRRTLDGVPHYQGTETQAATELEHARAAVRNADYKRQNVEAELKRAKHGADWPELEQLRRRAEAKRHRKAERFAMKIKNIKV